MLNSKALCEVLSKNSDGRLCKRWSIMTPNGTLLAYTTPTDMKDLRRQAAIAAMSWLDYADDQLSTGNPERDDLESHDLSVPGLLRTLTMENEQSNVIIRKLQPGLLLVLEGGVPPRKRAFEAKVTAEGPGDAPYPNLENRGVDSGPGSSASSVAESASTKANALRKTLVLQRGKLDALASAIASDLEKTGFRMPDGESVGLF